MLFLGWTFSISEKGATPQNKKGDKKMKNLAKILVLLLSVALVCGMLVMVTSADSGNVAKVGATEYPTLKDAYDAAVAENGEKLVTLIADCEVTETIAITSDVTIDLAGYKLSSGLSTAFTVNNAVSFTITGEGSIEIDGSLVTSTTTANDFTVNVVGAEKTKGIAITYTGTQSDNIVSTAIGTYNFKNLDIDATGLDLNSGSWGAWDAMFNNVTGSAGSKFYFTAVKFNGPIVGHKSNSSLSMIKAVGAGYVGVENSYFSGALNFLSIGALASDSTDTEIVRVENSYAAAQSIHAGATRLYIIDGYNPDSSKSETGETYGTINFVNSTVMSSCRMFCGGTTGSSNGIVVLDNSSAMLTGDIGSTGSAAYAVTRGFTVKLKNGGCLDTAFASNVMTCGSLNFEVGTRVSSTIPSAAVLPDGCEWVYDPTGNPNYPYVVASSSDAENYKSLPNWILLRNFNDIRVSARTATDSTVVAGLSQVATDGTTYYYHPYANETNIVGERVLLGRENVAYFSMQNSDGLQWAARSGSLYEINQTDGNSYLEYCVTPADTDKNTEDNTRTFNAEGRASETYNPWFVFGSNANYTSSDTHITTSGSYTRRYVMVAEMDFGSSSEYGYPVMTFATQSRAGSGTSNAQNSAKVTIKNDGSIVNGLRNAKTVTLNPIGEWNKLSIVAYSDPGHLADGGIAYFFVNGECIGDTTFFSTSKNVDEVFFMGFRVEVTTSDAQVIGSNFCVDNVTIRAYNSYQVAGECDGTATTTDGTTTYAKDGVHKPASYVSTFPATKYIGNGSIDVSGIKYRDINAAIADADANGTVAELTNNLTDEVKVEANGTVYANGYTVNLASDSYAANVFYDNAGDILKYVFNENYSNYKIQYYWLKETVDPNNFNPGDFNNFTPIGDPVIVGNAPKAPYSFSDAFDLENGKAASQIGWWSVAEGKTVEYVLDPISITDAENAGCTVDGDDITPGIVALVPLFGEYNTYTSYIKTSEGPQYAQYNNTESFAAYQGLTDGETLVLAADLIVTASTDFDNDDTYKGGVDVNNTVQGYSYTEEQLATMEAASAKLAVDLNGYDMINTTGGYNIAMIKRNTTLSIYSTKEGSEIYSAYTPTNANGEYYTNGQRMFGIHDRANYGKSRNSYNAHIYINCGSYIPENTYSLTLSGGVILEGLAGDDSTSIAADNVIMQNVAPTSGGMIMTRYYDGTITVTNSLILSPTTDNVIDMKAYYNDNTTNAIYQQPWDQDGDGTVTEWDARKSDGDSATYIYSPFLYMESCVIVNNGGNVIGNNGDGWNHCITFKNVTSNGRLNPSNAGGKRVRADEGVAAYNMAIGNDMLLSDIVITNYNTPMTMNSDLVSGNVYVMQIPYIADKTSSTLSYKTYYIANNGCDSEIPSGATNKLVLPILTTGTAKTSDVIAVTWAGIGTNANVDTTYYVKGGNVAATSKTVADYAMNATKLVFTDWGTLPTGVTENVTIYPNYTVKANIEASANLSIYSDFNVNLYIPVAYESYVTGVTVDNAAATLTKVDVDDDGNADYIMATVKRAANAASTDAQFIISIAEGEYTATASATVSVAAYAKAILDGETYTTADKQLMYYTATYASEAYKFFDENKAADEALTAIVENTTYRAAAGTLDDPTFGNKVENADAQFGAVFDSVTVNLGSAPQYVLTFNEGFVGTVTVTYGVESKTYEVTAADEQIVVSGMKAYNFGIDVLITATGTIGETAVSANGIYNLDTFVAYHVANAADADSETQASSEACLALLYAFYDYVTVATSYKAG